MQTRSQKKTSLKDYHTGKVDNFFFFFKYSFLQETVGRLAKYQINKKDTW